MLITSKLRFIFQRLREHYSQVQVKVVNLLTNKWILEGSSFIRYLACHQSDKRQKKQAFINSITKNQKVVFYVFRDLHLIDWFIPIHQALETRFLKKYKVIYINFGSTLQKVGDCLLYLPYLDRIESRLAPIPRASFQHFSDREIECFKNFPQPDLILTSETIRQEFFKTHHRVYLPHYTVPKANDTLPGKITYNHVFLPTTREFSYKSLNTLDGRQIQLHKVGYPKMTDMDATSTKLFENDNPTIIFAPSLDIKLIQSFIKQGILNVFKSLTTLNFIIKLHPTLSTKMHYLYSYLCQELKGEQHILLDTKSNIQAIGHHTRVMIADFGSIAAEYKLSFGKRLIFLDLPAPYEGGADLNFRDVYADSVTTVANLEPTIKDVLSLGDLPPAELTAMRNRVLFNWQDADIKAAEAIDTILS